MAKDKKPPRVAAAWDAAVAEDLKKCRYSLSVSLRPEHAAALVALVQVGLHTLEHDTRPSAEERARLTRAARSFILHVSAYFADQDASAILDGITRGVH